MVGAAVVAPGAVVTASVVTGAGSQSWALVTEGAMLPEYLNSTSMHLVIEVSSRFESHFVFELSNIVYCFDWVIYVSKFNFCVKCYGQCIIRSKSWHILSGFEIYI